MRGLQKQSWPLKPDLLFLTGILFLQRLNLNELVRCDSGPSIWGPSPTVWGPRPYRLGPPALPSWGLQLYRLGPPALPSGAPSPTVLGVDWPLSSPVSNGLCCARFCLYGFIVVLVVCALVWMERRFHSILFLENDCITQTRVPTTTPHSLLHTHFTTQ